MTRLEDRQTLIDQIAEARATLRANDNETATPREFTLEDA